MKNSSLIPLFQKIAAHIAVLAVMSLIFVASPSSPFFAHAETPKFDNPIAATSLSGLLESVLQVVIYLGAIVVVIYLILAGFKYVTARGDTTKISEAHQALTWTAIGGAVVLGAQVISKAIQGTVNELK